MPDRLRPHRSHLSRTGAAAAALTVALVAGGCSSTPDVIDTAEVPRLQMQIERTLPHDRDAFTQGLEISENVLYEGTGLEGQSFVRRSSLDDGTELGRVNLPSDVFGEGITIAGDTLWQISWQDGIAFERDPETLAERGRVTYQGEGWGLCARGAGSDTSLVMSDGSSTLTFRDSETFAPTGTVEVTLDGRPLDRLNELECAEDGSVYANIWQTFDIARIDPETGQVTAVVDGEPAWEAMSPEERRGVDVFNGIAQIPGTDRFLVTGKFWPTMFEVTFAEMPAGR